MSERDMLFSFESIGKTKILKVVEYSLISELNKSPVFNLGFGSYDEKLNEVSDLEVSGNGDAFKVFNTVLSTIPMFFSVEPAAVLLVSGSDSGKRFADNCFVTCSKKCRDSCRNEGRRISLYRKFIENNYTKLRRNYIFFGSMYPFDFESGLESFRPSVQYQSLLEKKLTLYYDKKKLRWREKTYPEKCGSSAGGKAG